MRWAITRIMRGENEINSPLAWSVRSTVLVHCTMNNEQWCTVDVMYTTAQDTSPCKQVKRDVQYELRVLVRRPCAYQRRGCARAYAPHPSSPSARTHRVTVHTRICKSNKALINTVLCSALLCSDDSTYCRNHMSQSTRTYLNQSAHVVRYELLFEHLCA